MCDELGLESAVEIGAVVLCWNPKCRAFVRTQTINSRSDIKSPFGVLVLFDLGCTFPSDCSWYVFGCTFAGYCAAGAVLGPLSPNRLLWHRVLNGYTPIFRAIGSATIIRFASPRLVIGYSRWLTFG